MVDRPYGPNPWQRADEESQIVRSTEVRQRPIAPVQQPRVTLEQDVPEEPQVPSERVLSQLDRASFRQDFLSIPGPSKASRLPKRAPLTTPEERGRFTPESIAQQKKYEAEMDRIEAARNDPLSPEFTAPELATPEARGIEGSTEVNRIDARNVLPAALRGDFDSKQDFMISNYPTLYAAAQNAGLSKEEIFDMTNLTLAVDAALLVATTRDERRVREIINSMAGPQAALVLDILNAMSNEGKKYDGTIGTRKLRKETEPDPDASLNPIANFIKSWAWDPSIDLSGLPFVYPDTDWGPIQDGEFYGGGKGAIDTFLALSEGAIRGISTGLFALGNVQETGQFQITDSWNATGAGMFDPVMMRKIRENNDPLAVDILLDLKKFAIMGDEDPEGSVYEKYGDDPRAAQIMDQIMFNTDPTSDMAILSNEIDLAETSNVGNFIPWLVSNMLGANVGEYENIRNLAENRFAMSGTRIATAGLTVAFDPTLGLSRFGMGVRGLKYGLAKMSKGQFKPLEPERLQKVFNTPGVRNHFDYVGRQFEDIRNTTTTKIVDGKEVTVVDEAAQAQKFNTLSSQMRKWYDYNALRVMYDAGVKNADDAQKFVLDGSNINLLLSGQAAKRGKEFTAPHMTKANAVWKAVTFKARGVNPANMGGPKRYLETLYGMKLADEIDDDIAAVMIREIEKDPVNAGRMLSDWSVTADNGVERTIFGKVIPPSKDSYKMRNRYGWRRKGIMTGDLGWFADRVGRLLARIPDTSLGVNVSSASDAKLIKQYIQSLGMSRYVANTIQFAWSTWDETTRIQFVNALNKSAVYSTGMDLVNPALADDLLRAFSTASKSSTKYAPDQIDVLAIRIQAEQNVRRMDDLRRDMNFRALTPEERASAVQEEIEGIVTGAVTSSRRTPIKVGEATSTWTDGPVLFHGTSQRFVNDELSDVLDLDQSRNIAGPGLYSTTGYKTASTGYTKKGKGTDPATYSIQWISPSAPRILDADEVAPQFVRDFFNKTLREEDSYFVNNIYEDARIYSVLDDPSSSTLDIIKAVRYSLSNDAVDPFLRYEVDEYLKDFNLSLQNFRFDALKHKGGGLRKDAIESHDVYVWFNTDNIRVIPVSDKAVRPSVKIEGLSRDERRSMLRSELIQGIDDAKKNGQISNPSALNDVDNYALYDPQLSGRVALFNPQAMNQLMARQSYLNILLGGGEKMTSFTDYWVLATLAGPRFVMRSGLEDFGLYAFTGGAFFGHDGWLMGRRASAAIRESIERVEPPVAPRLRGSNKGMPLSLATTARREIGTRLARRIPVARGLVLDYASPEELAQATAMASARGSERSREGIATLFGSLFARARFFSLNRIRYAKGEPLVLEGEAKQAADWLTDGVRRGYLNSNMDRAAETGQHLADGSLPAFQAPGKTSEVVDGVVLNYIDAAISPQRVKEVTQGYKTSWQADARNADDVENFYMELDTLLYQDGAKGYTAIARSPQYYKVKSNIIRAEESGDPKKLEDAYDAYNKFIDEYVEILEQDPNITRFVLAQELGMREFAIRKLDDALRMMTTQTGRFNNKLYNKLRLPEGAIPVGKGRKPLPDSERKFGLYYFDESGNLKYNVSRDALHDPELPMPQSVGGADKIPIPIADKLPLNTRAWNKMGRALARLTREPIYLANYVDMRKLIEPFRLRMVDDLVKTGKPIDDATEMADDWAARTAADKAYDLTMAYVDNPAIRSQLAWQVRNVARFYRALEDFNRRMVRVAENKPETFWKMALTWNVLDDSGFVWEDEFGEKYFLFPGTQVAFNAINGLASALGIQARVPSLPMTWGAKVSMLAPSTDPNALVPTLGSPFAALTVKQVVRLLPSLPVLDALARGLEDVPVAGAVAEFAASEDASRSIEGALFGEYSVNQTLTASLANDVFGPNLKRFFDAYETSSVGFASRNAATDSFIAGASKRAIHAVVASGIYDPKKDYTDEELQEIRMIADITAVNETWLRLFLTPMLIATPQSVSLTVSRTAREVGIDSGNALWLKYMNRYDSYDEAFIAFTRDNPGKAIFTVSKYESDDYYQMLVEVEDFIKSNMDEFKARPTGLSHFAPEEGTYGGLQSFYFMRKNGIRNPRTVEDFWQRSIRAAGQAEVKWIELKSEAARGNARDERSLDRIDKAEVVAKAQVKSIYPYAEYGMEFNTDRQSNFRRDADEIFATANYIIENNLDKDGRAAKYVNAYNQYQSASKEMNRAGNNDSRKGIVREAWRRYIQQNALRDFRGDNRGLRFLRILSGSLNIEVEGL